MKNRVSTLFSILLLALVLMPSFVVLQAATGPEGNLDESSKAAPSKTAEEAKKVPKVEPPVYLTDPLNFKASKTDKAKLLRNDPVEGFQTILGKAIVTLIELMIILSIIPVVWGGVQFIISRGTDSDGVTKGKQTLMWGFIGLLLSFSALIIVQFILTTALTANS